MYKYLIQAIPTRPSLTYLTSIDFGWEASPSTERDCSPVDLLQPALQDRKFFGRLLVMGAVEGFSLLAKGSLSFAVALKSVSLEYTVINEWIVAVLFATSLALILLRANFSFHKESCPAMMALERGRKC